MTDENVLLQYKDEHFGRFISVRPKNFADLKPFRKTKFPHHMHPEYDKKEDGYAELLPTPPTVMNAGGVVNSIWAARPNTLPPSYVPGLHGETFYDHVKNPDTGTYKNVPKRLPIIKHGEFIIKHTIVPNFEKKIYELLCIFPQDIMVPGNMRMFNYYGFSEWFEPFSAPIEEIQNFIKDYKSKINRKC